MTFLSYAQNFEDVMLWRALRQVGSGFYIDAGSQHPDIDSVTRAFYDRGWRGVNIEPVSAYIELLRAARPRDVNLGVALGERAGEAVLHIVEGSGLSTMDAATAARYAAEGQSVWPARVPVRTLAEICRDHAPRDIHFLKVDVEESEREVLAGADFATYRPWILVIEATRPNSPEPSFAAWEDLVLGAGYQFVWFDGLNRFYIATEHHDELARHFQKPPNLLACLRRFLGRSVARL